MPPFSSIAIWCAWGLLLGVSGLFSLFLVAFSGDDPSNKRRSERLVNVAVAAFGISAIGSYCILIRRDSFWDLAAGLAVAPAHVAAALLALRMLYK